MVMNMNAVMRKLLNSCQKSTELIDKQLISPLTATEKMQLNAHKAMCKTCNSYEKQSKLIDSALSKLFSFSNSKTTPKLDDSKKSKIIDLIKEI